MRRDPFHKIFTAGCSVGGWQRGYNPSTRFSRFDGKGRIATNPQKAAVDEFMEGLAGRIPVDPDFGRLADAVADLAVVDPVVARPHLNQDRFGIGHHRFPYRALDHVVG